MAVMSQWHLTQYICVPIEFFVMVLRHVIEYGQEMVIFVTSHIIGSQHGTLYLSCWVHKWLPSNSLSDTTRQMDGHDKKVCVNLINKG